MADRLIDQVWESGHLAARVARAVLTPFGWAYAGVTSLRNLAYDRGILAVHPVALPTVSVGNLTVGGTGKTPVAAWIVGQLRERGARPAIVLRGYGRDEPLVHARLNPGVPVIVGADRVDGISRAKENGATVAVLDDGFQHRRAHRDVDIVLLSADRFGPVRMLPAGPWREPLSSLRRAAMIVVTRKSASRLRAKELLHHAVRFAPEAAGSIVHLSVDSIVNVASGQTVTISTLRDRAVLAVSAIGDPRAFESQLRAGGALVEGAGFPDHHRYTSSDIARLVARIDGGTRVVCTLKDAVKLGPLWPREAPPLWYLSQRVVVEEGSDAFETLLTRLAPR
ncbi:MAG: tetraacyldisaccharide 4'-kinase [Gemmatimonadetes bacterium]|nr:tetraacyldisaccharide 4'-kinase [Gemmatimonadota bacterium]MBI3566880.1 tetraacyldisaccharide 4'-kinase [Gemmatimonadota bacterium]